MYVLVCAYAKGSLDGFIEATFRGVVAASFGSTSMNCMHVCMHVLLLLCTSHGDSIDPCRVMCPTLIKVDVSLELRRKSRNESSTHSKLLNDQRGIYKPVVSCEC